MSTRNVKILRNRSAFKAWNKNVGVWADAEHARKRLRQKWLTLLVGALAVLLIAWQVLVYWQGREVVKVEALVVSEKEALLTLPDVMKRASLAALSLDELGTRQWVRRGHLRVGDAVYPVLEVERSTGLLYRRVVYKDWVEELWFDGRDPFKRVTDNTGYQREFELDAEHPIVLDAVMSCPFARGVAEGGQFELMSFEKQAQGGLYKLSYAHADLDTKAILYVDDELFLLRKRVELGNREREIRYSDFREENGLPYRVLHKMGGQEYDFLWESVEEEMSPLSWEEVVAGESRFLSVSS